MPQPWERREGETAKAFRAFGLYRDLTPEKRSVAAAAASYFNRGVATASHNRQLERWSAEYDWPARAEAWDNHLDELGRNTTEDLVIEARSRHAAIARVAVGKAEERLLSIDPAELSAADALRYFTEAMKAERLALGDAGQIIEQRNPQTEAPTDDTEERLREVIAEFVERARAAE